MSASASASSIFVTPWAKRFELPAIDAKPAREGRWTRMLRWLSDRRHLSEMDAHLLCDVGLRQEDVRRGMPFRTCASHSTGLIRLGTLNARRCRLKLYVPVTEAAGQRPEDLAAARRAVRALLAELGPEPVTGFAVLSCLHDPNLPAESLVLTACRWEGRLLRRCTLLLPVADVPVHRLSDYGLGLPELRLAAREGEAWQRHTTRPSPSTLAAYLAEDCA